MVATNRPNTMLVATGPHSSDFPPSPVARENKPAIVVKAVMIIGTTRRRAAYMIACNGLMPASIRVFAASISTIAAFTAMPVKATMPYSVYRLSGLPVAYNPKTTPVKAIGKVVAISNGWK